MKNLFKKLAFFVVIVGVFVLGYMSGFAQKLQPQEISERKDTLFTNMPREYFDVSPFSPSDEYDVTDRVEIGGLPTKEITLSSYSNKKYPFVEPPSFPGKEPFYLEPADVDGDGNKEKIILTWTNLLYSRPNKLQIVKGEQVVFEVTDLPRVWFEQSESHKGFYIGNEIGDNKDCCYAGNRLVRFILESGEFKPVWEQKIMYLRIRR